MSYRITNKMMITNFMQSYHNSLTRMSRYQEMMQTNRRILRLSDDPVGILSSMTARNKLYNIEQYQRNVGDANTWMTAAETSLMNMNEVLKDAIESGIDAGGLKGPSDKQAIAQKIKQIQEHVLTQLNETVGDKYVFSGYNTTTKPFTLDAGGKLLYNGMDVETAAGAQLTDELGQKIMFEVGAGQYMDVAIPGIRVTGVGPDNLYNVLGELYDKLMADDGTASIMQTVEKLQDKQSHVLAMTAEIGGKCNRLDLLEYRYKADYLNYTEMKSNVEDCDQAEAIMQFEMAKAVYQSALSVGAKIIQPTLTDFLR